MERVTISMSDELADELTAFMQSHKYANRSEAIRDLARQGLKHARIDALTGECVAALSYVYNHHARDLSRRLTDTYHAHHDLQVATMHVHLDHDSCLEITLLRGEVSEVKGFANVVIAERGVTHGQVSFVPVKIETGSHTHGGDHAHVHTHPSG
jgi:CopG family nickel-responsive transcriptional regulator